MKPYGQKRDWSELEMANKHDRGKNTKGNKKKKTKHWKKRARADKPKGNIGTDLEPLIGESRFSEK